VFRPLRSGQDMTELNERLDRIEAALAKLVPADPNEEPTEIEATS
jgi:hypothetical protein